ncbi:MAG TPA: permease [Gemmataceae bacterium]|nr:permease [Gemmataceae bacterium]
MPIDQKSIEAFTINFTSILYEAMPFIVLGVILSGLLEEFVPQKFVARIIPRSRVLAIAIGGLLGILFPMCECGIIPIMRRLLRKGVPLSCCTCYMLAGPIINVVVMISTFAAFSGTPTGAIYKEEVLDANKVPHVVTSYPQLGPWWMMGCRMGLGFLVAFGTSLLVEQQYRKHGNKLLNPLAVPPEQKLPNGADEEDELPARKRTFVDRLSTITETALHDFVDVTVYLILGAILASAGRLILKHDAVEALATNFFLSICVMMALAILLCICSEADAFVAASFRMLPPSAKLGFLVLGPMLDLKLYMMYTRIFRPRLIWTIITSVVVQVFLYALLTHAVIQYFLAPSSMGSLPGP